MGGYSVVLRFCSRRNNCSRACVRPSVRGSVGPSLVLSLFGLLGATYAVYTALLCAVVLLSVVLCISNPITRSRPLSVVLEPNTPKLTNPAPSKDFSKLVRQPLSLHPLVLRPAVLMIIT